MSCWCCSSSSSSPSRWSPTPSRSPCRTKPRTIVVAVDREGDFFWNDTRLADANALLENLKQRATDEPQPEVHIRADKDVRYAFVGRVVAACQRAGIAKVAFITEPERGTAGGG
jgi:biopolymer transport protein ExbD